MDTYTFFLRNDRTEDKGIKRRQRATRSPRYYEAYANEAHELAEQLTEDMGGTQQQWLRRLGVRS